MIMISAQDKPVAQLLSNLDADLEKWKTEEDIDFLSRYESAIQAIGEVEFLTELFRRFEGTTLMGALNALPFAWKNLPFSSWQQVLRRISEDTDATYQLVWFASPFLGVDILSMIQSDPDVHDAAKEFVNLHFASGAPRGTDSDRELLERIGIDPLVMWRRLAREGAPMKVDLTGIQ